MRLFARSGLLTMSIFDKFKDAAGDVVDVAESAVAETNDLIATAEGAAVGSVIGVGKAAVEGAWDVRGALVDGAQRVGEAVAEGAGGVGEAIARGDPLAAGVETAKTMLDVGKAGLRGRAGVEQAILRGVVGGGLATGKALLKVAGAGTKAYACIEAARWASRLTPIGMKGLNWAVRHSLDATGGGIPKLGFGKPSQGEIAQLAVVDGAKLKCEFGTTPSLLHASGANVEIRGIRVATIDDHKPGKNIRKFGTCKKKGGRCEPKTPKPWAPPIPNIPLAGPSALHVDALLKCTTGGSDCISIVDPGQVGLLLSDVAKALLEDAIDALPAPFSEADKEKIKEDLVNSTSPTCRALLWALFRSLGTPENQGEALRGGHFRIPNGSALYELFKRNGGYTRSSSHGEVQVEDLGFDLPAGGTILIAKDALDRGVIRVQMERHGARSQPAEHMLDWCEGGQLGPYGASEYTDKNPRDLSRD